MIPPEEGIIVDAGLDWLTITEVNGVETGYLMQAAYEAKKELYGETAISKPWRAMGYQGTRVGQISSGIRGDGEGIMICSGESASRVHRLLDINPTRVTRVDLQVTLALAKVKQSYAADLYRMLPHLPGTTRLAKVTTFYGSVTGDTLYLGRRDADVSLRIYDKSLDFDYPVLGAAWRYEVQYRRDAAKTVMVKLVKEETPVLFIAGQVMAELKKRKILSSFGAGSKISAIEVKVRVASVESQLDWLARCVSPVILKLIDLGYEQEAIHALQLKTIKVKGANYVSKRGISSKHDL